MSKLICPFHGLLEAVQEKDEFHCPVEGCSITRTEKELETEKEFE